MIQKLIKRINNIPAVPKKMTRELETHEQSWDGKINKLQAELWKIIWKINNALILGRAFLK